MRVNDALLGSLLVVFAAALALYSRTLPNVPGQQYGASVFPTLIAMGFFGTGVLLIVSGMRTRGPLVSWADWARERHGLRNVVVTVLAVVFYIVASEWLGFMLTMAPILLVLLRLFGVGWTMSTVVSIATTLVIQYSFGTWLYVPLPWGLLAPVRWW